MRPRSEDLQRLAISVIREMRQHEYIHVLKDDGALTSKIVSIVQASFDQEQELEREAERLAAQHAGKMLGMDQRRIIQGIKTRLAEEKNFPL